MQRLNRSRFTRSSSRIRSMLRDGATFRQAVLSRSIWAGVVLGLSYIHSWLLAHAGKPMTSPQTRRAASHDKSGRPEPMALVEYTTMRRLLVLALAVLTSAGCVTPVVLEDPVTRKRVNCTLEARRMAYD